MNKAPENQRPLLLSYRDSNPERQNQNLLCYHYTIAQSALLRGLPRKSSANIVIIFFDTNMAVIKAFYSSLHIFGLLKIHL